MNIAKAVKELRERKPATPRVVAENIIKLYGRDKFLALIDLLSANETGSKIGFAFGVTRQRVWQWRKTLGVESTTYALHPDVELLVDKRSRNVRRTAV